MNDFDSTQDTLDHIRKVRKHIGTVTHLLGDRGRVHDASKLEQPEKAAYDVLTPRLAGLTYGSDEYRASLREMKPAIQHHYAHNTHHPEHYSNGIAGMSLLDLLEMFCDWKAASERHNNGDFSQSLVHNATRFEMTDQLAAIFENTARELGWTPQETKE